MASAVVCKRFKVGPRGSTKTQFGEWPDEPNFEPSRIGPFVQAAGFVNGQFEASEENWWHTDKRRRVWLGGLKVEDHPFAVCLARKR